MILYCKGCSKTWGGRFVECICDKPDEALWCAATIEDVRKLSPSVSVVTEQM